MRFKEFFKDTISDTNKLIQNEQYVSNTHFLFKKEILTPKQLEYLNSFPITELNNNRIESLLNSFNNFTNIETVGEYFTPDYIIVSSDEKNNPSILFNNNIFLNKDYYNFLTSRQCKICALKSESKNYPLGIFKNHIFVGILMQFRSQNTENAVPYDEYLKQQEEYKLKKQQENEKYTMGKCIHVSGIERKQMEFIKEYKGMKFYCLKGRKENYDFSYTELNGYMLPITSIANIEKAVEDIQNKNMDLHKWIEDFFNNRINDDNYECGISIGYAQYLNREDEAVAYNNIIKNKNQVKREEENKIREEKKKQKEEEEERQYQKYITEAEDKYMNSERITNGEFVDLCDRYKIKLPLRTRGWVLKSLCNIKYSDDIGCSYQYRGNASTVIGDYAEQLYKSLVVVNKFYNAIK